MVNYKLKKKKKINIEIDIKGIKHADIMMFTQHLSVALQSGFTLTEAISMLEDAANGKMKKVLRDIMEVIESGQPLFKALEKYPKYFSPIYTNMVRTGELAGTLAENLSGLAVQLKKAHKMRQKVKAAMMYPMFVFIAIIGLALSIAFFVLPKILPLFKSFDVELPLTTQGLLYVADLFEKHGMSILIGMIVGTIVSIWLLRRQFLKPFLHGLFLKLPVIGPIVMQINLQRLTLILGTLLESGLSLVEVLQITSDATENRVYRKAISTFVPAVQKGNSIAAAMEYHPKLFPKFTSRMIGMGEQTGNLEQNLKYLSQFYEGEVDNIMKNLSTIIEPIMLIGIGILVGTVAISILGPIYQITGSFRN